MLSIDINLPPRVETLSLDLNDTIMNLLVGLEGVHKFRPIAPDADAIASMAIVAVSQASSKQVAAAAFFTALLAGADNDHELAQQLVYATLQGNDLFAYVDQHSVQCSNVKPAAQPTSPTAELVQ